MFDVRRCVNQVGCWEIFMAFLLINGSKFMLFSSKIIPFEMTFLKNNENFLVAILGYLIIN